jgi:azurin
MTLSYHPPGKAEVLAEKRTLTASAPDAAGSYHIDWRSEFAAKGNKVVLDRTPLPGQLGGAGHGGYAGLSIRVAKANVPWNFLDSEGRVNDSHGKQARWLNHSGEIADGREAGLTMFDHPDNVGHPSRWFTVRGMPYFSPAVIFSNPLTLDSDEKLDLRYRILVQARKGTTAELDRQHARFVGTLSAKSNNPNSTKHVHTLAPKPSLEKRPVPPGFERLDHVIHVGVQKGKLRYKVEEFTVKPGSRVKVVLANTDDMQHNILFCKPGSGVALAVAQKAWMMGAAAMEKQFVPEDDRVLFASRIVGVGETDEIYFVAPDKEADYPYVCSLPGHAFTMKGVMTVTEKETTPHPKPDQEQPVYVDYDVVVKDRPLGSAPDGETARTRSWDRGMRLARDLFRCGLVRSGPSRRVSCLAGTYGRDCRIRFSTMRLMKFMLSRNCGSRRRGNRSTTASKRTERRIRSTSSSMKRRLRV